MACYAKSLANNLAPVLSRMAAGAVLSAAPMHVVLFVAIDTRARRAAWRHRIAERFGMTRRAVDFHVLARQSETGFTFCVRKLLVLLLELQRFDLLSQRARLGAQRH